MCATDVGMVTCYSFFVFSMQGILCHISYLIIHPTILFATAGACIYIHEPKNKWQWLQAITMQDSLYFSKIGKKS